MNRFNSDKVKKLNEDEIPETKIKTLKTIEALCDMPLVCDMPTLAT